MDSRRLEHSDALPVKERSKMNPYPVEELIHYCNVKFSKSNQIFAQTIDYYDLTFVLSGRLIYYADKTRYILNKNDAIVTNPTSM